MNETNSQASQPMSRELFEAIRSWTATVENILDPAVEYNPRVRALMEQLARYGCDIRQRTPEAKAHGLAGVEQPPAPETVGVKALASASGSANPWQLGVASMAENARAGVEWSRQCLKRGDDPNVILDRMDKWLKEIIEQIYSPNAPHEPCGTEIVKQSGA